jgi:hypothetical protein
MSEIFVYKIKTPRLDPERLVEIARFLELEGQPIVTDEALMLQDSSRVLVYAQPGSKLAGHLFYSDRSRGLAEVVDELLSVREAEAFANSFARSFALTPRTIEDGRIRFSLELGGEVTEAVTFDGEERRTSRIKTEISSKIYLNDIRVVGPRAKVRMVFKEQDKPILANVSFLEKIEVYEERELIREHDIVMAVKEKLADRKGQRTFNVLDVKLAYFAHEYNGGPDLLAPYYFVEVEYKDINAPENVARQGPRQLIHLPAYTSY